MLRTVPPPDGMLARANLSVFGLNWMIVFGFTPDSLYHTNPSAVIAIPYGSDPGPPGDGHVFTAPETGSSRPRLPLLKSVKYTLSLASIAYSIGRAAYHGSIERRYCGLRLW
jgi:hypothetical protein